MLMMNEPGEPKKTVIRKGVKDKPDLITTVWDRWETDACMAPKITLGDVIEKLEEEYKL